MLRKVLTVAVITGVALLTVPLHAAAAQASDRVVIQLKCEGDGEDGPCSSDWPGGR